MSKNLILYYSREGENYWEGGTLRNLEKGNTRYVAEFIRDAVGGDLFRIETVQDYPAEYKACTEAGTLLVGHLPHGRAQPAGAAGSGGQDPVSRHDPRGQRTGFFGQDPEEGLPEGHRGQGTGRPGLEGRGQPGHRDGLGPVLRGLARIGKTTEKRPCTGSDPTVHGLRFYVHFFPDPRNRKARAMPIPAFRAMSRGAGLSLRKTGRSG